MAGEGGEDPRQVYLEGPKQQVLNSDSTLLEQKRDRPIEKPPTITSLVRIPKKQWLSDGPKDALPPAVRYDFKNNGKDQTWESVAAELGRTPEWLIWYNFKLPSPIDKAVVNWFLRDYVGATVPTADFKNWTFENTTTGYIWVPRPRAEGEATARDGCEALLGRMKEIERSFSVDAQAMGDDRYPVNKPYLSALKGYADTMNAQLFPGDYMAHTGTDVLEEPPEFPVPPTHVDVTRYRPQGYGVGFRAALRAWDELPARTRTEIRSTMARDCVNKLYGFLTEEAQRLTKSVENFIPGYPPPPAER